MTDADEKRHGSFFRNVPFWVDLLALYGILVFGAYQLIDICSFAARDSLMRYRHNLSDTFGRLNACEGIFWMLSAWTAYIVLRWQRRCTDRTAGWIAVWLTLFGVSDLIEVYSGTWWRPWWLLLWKAICVIAIVSLLVTVRSHNKGVRFTLARLNALGEDKVDEDKVA